MKKTELVIINIKENIFISIIKDFFTFLCLTAPFFVNYRYLGNSTLIKWFIILIMIAWVFGRSSTRTKRFTNKQEAIAYIHKVFAKWENNKKA
jgi:hypothetical protein